MCSLSGHISNFCGRSPGYFKIWNMRAIQGVEKDRPKRHRQPVHIQYQSGDSRRREDRSQVAVGSKMFINIMLVTTLANVL